jgi:hypothetical protein
MNQTLPPPAERGLIRQYRPVGTNGWHDADCPVEFDRYRNDPDAFDTRTVYKDDKTLNADTERMYSHAIAVASRLIEEHGIVVPELLDLAERPAYGRRYIPMRVVQALRARIAQLEDQLGISALSAVSN